MKKFLKATKQLDRQTKLISCTTFSISVIENCLTDLQNDLQDFSQTQGRQDGQKQYNIPESSFRVKIIDFTKSQGQRTIDFIKQTVLVAPQILHIRELEQLAKHKCEQTQLSIDDKEHQLVVLQRAKKTCVIDPFKSKYAKWLLPIALFVGCADGVMAYGGFRSASYSTMLALIASVAIALVVSVSHILYAPWIMQSKKKLHRIIKIATVLFAAFIFFFWISNIRAGGINNSINISVPAYGSQVNTAPHISQWAICGISFVLFIVILFFSLVVWQNKEERLQSKKYKKLCSDITQLEGEIAVLQKEITDTQTRIAVQKSDARITYDYVIKSIHRVKNICEAAIATYKQNYARFHQTVPDFFVNKEKLQYDENLQLFEPEKQEA